MHDKNIEEKIIRAIYSKYITNEHSKLLEKLRKTKNEHFNKFGLNSSIYCSAILKLWETYILLLIEELLLFLKTNNRNDIICNDNIIVINIINELLEESNQYIIKGQSFESQFKNTQLTIKEKAIEKWNAEAELIALGIKGYDQVDTGAIYKPIKFDIGSQYSHYISVGVGFIEKSINLIQEKDENAHRLAIISAYHGLEFFLYGCLKDNISIFKTPNDTIGFNKALLAFNDYLKKENLINGDIEYLNDLLLLSNRRNDVIHKAGLVSDKETLSLINVVIKFININAKRLFNEEILKHEKLEIKV